jgi:signal transduction histidine kinase
MLRRFAPHKRRRGAPHEPQGTMTHFDMREWLARVRRSKLSTRVTVLFGAALILPWCAYAWLTLAQRAEHVERAERNLATLAAAYGQHATTLMRRPIQGPAGDVVSTPGLPMWTTQVEEGVSAFRAALNVPGVTFSLRRPGAPGAAPAGSSAPNIVSDFIPAPDDRNAIVAEVDRASAGLGAIASMRRAEALRDWRASVRTQAIALFIRSLFVLGVGWFLVRQLRWREAMERELVSARDKAESASRAKSEFLANMSHELRTPLNAIIGFAEIIKRRTFGPASERYPEYAGDIYNSGTHLLALINDILNLSKLEAGKFQLQERDVDLAAMVDACMRLVEEPARQWGIRLSVSLDPEALFIRADERRLRQILINLLSNAVKFTSEGGNVRVTSVRRNGGLAISVSDNGIGMAPEDIPKALTPFGQIESKVRRKQEGTGLGLALAKQLVELHGGILTIDSTINVGTTVTLLLPASRMIASPRDLLVASAAG